MFNIKDIAAVCRVRDLGWVVGVAVLLLFVGRTSAAEPHVVSTTPSRDQRDVDPTVREIRVKFDQPMDHSGQSITGGGPTFPQITGKTLWIDAQTLAIPVRLQPNHVYQMGFNSPSFQNFTNRQGEPAVPYLLKFRTASRAGVHPKANEAAAPEVAKTVPANGAKDVRPDLSEITIRFSRPMDTSGFSIVGGGPGFPKLLGRPKWADDRTLIIRVDLEPEHQYSLSINSEQFENCRSKEGVAATPFPLTFRTGKSAVGSDAGDQKSRDLKRNQESIDMLREAIDQDYSYRDLRHVDWAAQFRKYGPDMARADSPQQFAKLVAKLLEPAGDLHLSVHVGDEVLYPDSSSIPPSNFDIRLVRREVPNWAEHGKLVATGQFPDGPAYVLIRLWDPSHERDLDAAFEQIKKADPHRGLILDVRPNGGGDEPMAQRFAGCFVDTPRVYGKDEIRSAGRFQGPFDRILEPNSDGPHYRGKIAVLMGPRCVSSNESFLLMMRTVPGCKLIGSHSRGASGNPKPTELPNGVTVYLSSWRDMLPDGTCFEGVGIAPDLEVPASAGVEAPGHDPVLAAALEYLKRSE